MAERDHVDEPGRVEVQQVRHRQPAVRGNERLEVTGQLEREPVGGGLPSTRQGALERQGDDLERRGHEQHEGDDPRVSRSGRADGSKDGREEQAPQHGHRHRHGAHAERRCPGHVAEPPVPQFVGHHQPDLPRPAPREQRVEHHHPPGLAQARDVRVLLLRPTAGVGDENVPDGHAGPPRQGSERLGELTIRRRFEPVEQRLQEHGRHERERHDERRAGGGHGEGPGSREGPGQPHEPHHRQRREGGSDREPLQPVGHPAPERLGGEPPRLLPHVPAPERKRQPNHERHGHHDQREGEGPTPPRQPVHGPVHAVSRAAEREHAERPQ